MHDIGSVQQENGWGQEMGGNFEQGFGNQFEGAFESNLAGEFANDLEFLGEDESGFGMAGESTEMQEFELAAELLAVTNEQELEQFLGNVFRRAAGAAGNFIRSPAGQALGGILKNVARQALPVVGSALGNLVVPGAGGVVGGKLASLAGRALGLELEGLSAEDREFEVARRIVRIGTTSARQLAALPASAPPAAAARNVFLQAARQVAPGLINTMRNVAQGAINTAASSAGQAFGAAAGATLGNPTPTGACSTCTPGRPAHWRRTRDGRGIVVFIRLR